jgi:hypothetical protein
MPYIAKRLKIKLYKINIMSFVLYGCEVWSCTLRVEYKLLKTKNHGKYFGS